MFTSALVLCLAFSSASSDSILPRRSASCSGGSCPAAKVQAAVVKSTAKTATVVTAYPLVERARKFLNLRDRRRN